MHANVKICKMPWQFLDNLFHAKTSYGFQARDGGIPPLLTMHECNI